MKYSIITKIAFVIGLSIFLSGCASIFIPKRQKVNFIVKNKDSKIYLDKNEIGNGPSVKEKVEKNGSHQIVVKTPGYKDSYTAMVQCRRPAAYWCLLPLNILNLGYGLMIDGIAPKNVSYSKEVNLEIGEKLVNRNTNEKFIDISNINLNINNKNKDINVFTVRYNADVNELKNSFEEAEKNKEKNDIKKDLKKAKKSKGKQTLEENQEIKYDDTKFSYDVYRTLKKTGFVDTVNKIFVDNNNTLVLEGSISKVNFFWIVGKKATGAYYKTKVYLKWYVKNTFGQVLDSVDTQEYSGDFTLDFLRNGDSFMYEKIIGDAVDISYLKLHKNSLLSKYLKQDNNFTISDPLLYLKAPKLTVNDKSDAALASVIVKTKNGHGSGFAITEDGYVITNYHVIAGRFEKKASTVTVIKSNGEEVSGTIIRYNKFRDLALIKINSNFEKVFKVSSVKSFKNLQDVYTIGAPKSIELGQTISSGVISNERKNNNNYLLQLGMSVNSGNSGGPIFDNTGALHGVVVSKLFGQNTEGISFAIPGHLIEDYLKIKYSLEEDPSKKKK